VSDAVARKGHLADQQVCASAAHDEKSRNDGPFQLAVHEEKLTRDWVPLGGAAAIGAALW